MPRRGPCHARLSVPCLLYTSEPDKTAEPPKRRGRPPKEAQAKAPADKKKAAPAKEPADKKKTSIWKEPADKATGGKEKAPKVPAPKKAADKGSAAVKSPAPEQPKQQEPPKEAPRRGEEQIVYIKLDELHAFKNHPFQVRDDEMCIRDRPWVRSRSRPSAPWPI